jgi:hypothetical protein
MKLNTKIFLFLLLITMIFISGCTRQTTTIPETNKEQVSTKTVTTPIGGNVQQTIPENYSEIYHKLQECGTSIQCDAWINSYLNTNRVQWTGRFVDATSEFAIVLVEFIGDPGVYYNEGDEREIFLYDIPASDLIKLKSGQNITFNGQLKIKTDSSRLYDRAARWEDSSLQLYDVKIQNI